MILHFFRRPILTVLIGSLCLQVSATPENEQSSDAEAPCASRNGQVAGAVIGALLGGFLGNKVGKGNGKKLATVAGALGGLAVGNYIGSELDRRKCEVSKIAQKNNLVIAITDIALPASDGAAEEEHPLASGERVGMSLAIQDRSAGATDAPGGDSLGNAALSSQFQSGSAVLSEEANGYFREIVGQYATPFTQDALPQSAGPDEIRAVQGLRQKRILIVGHTDDTGSSRMNADLSEQRARNVARLFADAGVPIGQVFYQGSGETQPIADNRSEGGRARNRRVEIIDLPDERAFQKYLSNRVANTSYYRVRTETATLTAMATDNTPSPGKAAMPAQKPARTSHARASVVSAAAPASTDRPQTSRPALNPRPTSAAQASAGSGYDFGGMPAVKTHASIDIGKPLTQRSGFNIISPAMADDMPTTRSCSEDRPRFANAVKDLQSNREYHVSQYLPNLYDTSWTDTVNGNLVALTHVAVLRDGAAPARNPTVLVYKASNGKPAVGSKADFNGTAHVNTYQGERGLLYRVFVDGPIKCMDLVIPRDQPAQAANSNLYYQSGTTTMVAAFNPRIVK